MDKMENQAAGLLPRPPPTEPRSFSVSRKRPRTDESPRDDSDDISNSDSKNSSLRRGYDMYTPARDLSTQAKVHGPHLRRDNLSGELKIRGISAPVETKCESGDDGLPPPLPPRFSNALERLNRELEVLDEYFHYKRKWEGKRRGVCWPSTTS